MTTGYPHVILNYVIRFILQRHAARFLEVCLCILLLGISGFLYSAEPKAGTRTMPNTGTWEIAVDELVGFGPTTGLGGGWGRVWVCSLPQQQDIYVWNPELGTVRFRPDPKAAGWIATELPKMFDPGIKWSLTVKSQTKMESETTFPFHSQKHYWKFTRPDPFFENLSPEDRSYTLPTCQHPWKAPTH